VTFWNFAAMALGAAVVLVASAHRSLALFIAGFVLLFVFSGIGNGSTYKMIPAIYRAKVSAEEEARRLSGALIGLAGAIGAFGGVMVNLAFRQSFLAYGSGTGAYVTFMVFYALCAAVTWVVYLRDRSLPGV
jgi:NNP family nitrate/nitrite transporter-like MFS transporter